MLECHAKLTEELSWSLKGFWHGDLVIVFCSQWHKVLEVLWVLLKAIKIVLKLDFVIWLVVHTGAFCKVPVRGSLDENFLIFTSFLLVHKYFLVMMTDKILRNIMAALEIAVWSASLVIIYGFCSRHMWVSLYYQTPCEGCATVPLPSVGQEFNGKLVVFVSYEMSFCCLEKMK